MIYLVECHLDSIEHVCDRIRHVMITNYVRLQGLSLSRLDDQVRQQYEKDFSFLTDPLPACTLVSTREIGVKVGSIR